MDAISTSLRAQRSNPWLSERTDGLLRCARNDDRFRDRARTPSAFLRLLPAQLHLAVALGAALAVVLRAALDRHRIVGHVLGDHRARTDIGAVADLHRRHQRRIGADEGALADDGPVLAETVIVAGDGAGAEIGIAPDIAIANIGKIIDLDPSFHRPPFGPAKISL